MSYSVGATRATKAEVLVTLAEELSKVPVAQLVHQADAAHAFFAAKSLLDLMADDPARDIYCSVSGSIWKTDAGVQNISLSIRIRHEDRKAS